MEEKNCPQCGNKLFHNQGVSKKTGKLYENYKCGKCSYIEWVDDIKPKTQGFEKAVGGGGNEEVLNALREVYKEIEELRKEFKEFVRIFSNK